MDREGGQEAVTTTGLTLHFSNSQMMDSPSLDSAIQDVTQGSADRTVQWFQKAGTDSGNDQTLQPANQAIQVQERHRFKQKLRGLLNSKHAATTKTELEQQIENYEKGHEYLKEQAYSAINDAADDITRYQIDRMVGGKKIGRMAQNFVTSFADFLKAYSGIVELLKGAGQVYGTVAYETLSILFIVVVNKSGNDSKIGNLLFELRKSFPQLDDWVTIYPTTSIKMLVAEVYTHVIKFARDASIYFTRFSTRLWMGIGKPPSMGIDRTVATVHGKLAEINSEAMLQLHKRSQNIQATVEDSNDRIKGLKRMNGVLVRSLERLEIESQKLKQEIELKNRDEDKQRLERLKETLKIEYPCPEIELESCKQCLSKAFPTTSTNQRSLRVEYTQMTRTLLHTSEAYNKWRDAIGSCLLVLSGRTVPDARTSRGYTHSWLSPATNHIAEELRKDGRLVAYYSCHPGVRAEEHTGKEIMSTIIYQILDWKPNILRRKDQQFRSMLQSEAWSSPEDEKPAVGLIFQLLREVLLDIKDLGTVFLVLDRVDLCSWKLHNVMAALVHLVGSESCMVKIVVVLDTARGEWDSDRVEESALDRVMIHQAWDQRKLSPREVQKRSRSR